MNTNTPNHEPQEQQEQQYYFRGKRESKRFWRLVSKYHPDHLRIATEFNAYHPEYAINDLLFFLNECREGLARCPGRSCYIPAAKCVTLTEAEILARVDNVQTETPINPPDSGKRAIFNVPNLIQYLKALNSDNNNSLEECTIHNQKVLIIAKSMLREYLRGVVDCVVDIERERRNLMGQPDSVLRIRDARLVYAAVESMGGSLKVSTEAVNALNKFTQV